jgi:hypothetical protein
VVKDPVDEDTRRRKLGIPGVLGCNALRDINSLAKQNNIKVPTHLSNILALYEELPVKMDTDVKVRIVGEKNRPILIPARSLQVVAGSTKASRTPITVLIEEISPLTKGLSLGRTIVTVDHTGRVPIQLANFSDKDIYLKPKTLVGILNPTEIESPYKVVQIGEHESVGHQSGLVENLLKRMDTNSNLSKSQGEKLRDVLGKHTSSFSTDEDDIGFCDAIRHKIVLTDSTPVRVPHRRIPPSQWQEVREYICKSLEKGVIRESSSPYAAPVVLVRKGNKLRVCCDYRALNAKTRKDAYPLPRIEEALTVLMDAKYFCSLDRAHGFNQVAVDEADIEKTAYRSGTGGLYEYLRMPFGLTRAPATFMRLMDNIFGDENFQTLLIYLDDILVFGTTFEETLERLDMVLTRLSKYNLKVKPEKCQLFKEKLRYLGHIVSEEGIAPDPGKTCAVSEWKIQLRRRS